jgi:PAS domain S-box-containing protein
MLSAVIVTAEIQYRIVRSRLLLEIDGDARLREAQAQNTTLGADLRKLEHRAEVIKRSQIDARRRADALSHHMQNTLLPVIECDGTGRIVEWNQAATAAFGYKLADLSQRSLDQFLSTPPADRAWKDVFASALEGKLAAAVDVVVVAKNGQAIPSKFYITPIDIDGTKSSRAAIIATPFNSDRTDRATPYTRLQSVRKG